MEPDAVTNGASSRLRVLHVVLSVGETSAAYNEHCLPILERRDISLCTYFRPTVAIPPAIHVYGGDDSLPGFIRSLRSALRTNRYDVIHAHSPHVALLFLVTASLWARDLPASTVVTVHDSYPNFRWRNRLLLLPSFACFDHVVCCSKSSFSSFPPLYHWLARGRLTAVQNGLDLDRVHRVAAGTNCREKDGLFNVLSISRLVEIKNPSTVLDAFSEEMSPGSHLTFIGHGPLRRDLVSACSSNGADHQVTFTGLLPREQVFEHILGADLFVSASLGEGLPVAVLEAMACGCPVLLSDIPPHREIAKNADFIPLVRPRDKDGFAREIAKFRCMSAVERVAIGEKCRLLVEEQFSLEAMHAGYEAIYRNL